MNTPNYPPPSGPPGGPPPGRPGPYGPPPGGRPPQTPPGGQHYGPPQPGGHPYGPPPTPPGGRPYGGGPGGPGGPGPYGPGPGGPGPNRPDDHGPGGPFDGPPPGGYPTPPPPAPTPPKKGNSKLVRIGAALVVVVVGIGVYLFLNKDAPSSGQAGECIKVNDVASADIEKIDCGSPDAQYTIGLTKDDAGAKCPNGNYLAYTESGGSSDVLLCLVLNAKQGDCFKSDGQAQVKVDCAKGAEFKVAKVIKGSDDPKQCGAENAANAVAFPEPKLTLCLAPPDGTAS